MKRILHKIYSREHETLVNRSGTRMSLIYRAHGYVECHGNQFAICFVIHMI
jgi:hypothetical protein